MDRRTTRHLGYAISLSRRWLVEKSFGWLKQTGPLRQVKLRGLHKVDWIFVFNCAPHTTSCACQSSSPSKRRKAFSSSAPERPLTVQQGSLARTDEGNNHPNKPCRPETTPPPKGC